MAGRIAMAMTGSLALLVIVTGLSRTGPEEPPVGAGPEKPSPTASVDILPVSYWEGKYLDAWDHELETAGPLSRSADSWDHYGLSYDVDANTAMFRATGRKKYLDRALGYVSNVVDTARVSSSLSSSQYRDGYRGWLSFRADLDPPGVEVPLYESYFWRYATTLLRTMKQTPSVYEDPAYRATYDRLLRFAEVDIFAKWYSRGANETIYRSRTHMAAHWAIIAFNLSLISDDAERRTMYRTVVESIDLRLPNYPSGLRTQMKENPVEPTAYFWSDVWGSSEQPGQDVSHGNAVVSYIVEGRDHGTSWTATDITRLTALLTTVIWPRDRVFPAYVDGTGTDNGWWSDGFVKLGRYGRETQQRLERHPVTNSQFVANMALNARILGQAPTG